MDRIEVKSSLYLRVIIPVILVINVFLIYGQLINHSYINFDDPGYVSENPVVRAGLTKQGILWALSTTHMANWHPLTWLSHMLDVELFGVSPGEHHLVNGFLHALNAVLLFLVLLRMTGRSWESGFVAVLFTIHPLHVESVAWLAERKDTLSAFFWFASIYTYSVYVNSRKMVVYFMMLFFYALGLMSKPMVVTLPLVLLLLDYWPLGRLSIKSRNGMEGGHEIDLKSIGSLLSEKIPLFFLSLGSCIVTYMAQQIGGGIPPGEMFPLGTRIGNAVVCYTKYLTMAAWPVSLSVFYPHPLHLPIWKVVGSVLILATLSYLSMYCAKKRPYFAVGWFWYLGTLAPVIGVVQIGGQELADRYAYIPLIGIYVIVAWGISDTLARRREAKYLVGILACASVFILASAAKIQASYWRNSVTLFTRSIESTSRNALAHLHLGAALDQGRETEKAIPHYVEALSINPNYLPARYNLALALQNLGKFEESMANYKEALRIKPESVEVRNNLGVLLAQQGKYEEAISQFQEALRLNPDNLQTRSNLEIAVRSMKRKD